MDISPIFDQLNDAQRQAVSAENGPLLVLAGAGSGKTRVLTSRIAYLMQTQSLSPLSVLAVTFTNKASKEMRARVEQLLEYPVSGMWIGTFHGIAHRLLRLHYQSVNLPHNFQIMDSDDQLRMIKRCLKELELDEAFWPAKQAQWFINHQKEEGMSAQQVNVGQEGKNQTLLKIYAHYEALCQQLGLLDFAQLLLMAFHLLKNNPAILAQYQRRFAHVLVDEFQDTNTIQYAWLKLLLNEQQNLFAVGDDDQSIYGWRGAKVENMLQFERDFPQAMVIRLEQNYRSTSQILSAANAVIEQNQSRLGKNLWSAKDQGDKVKVYAAFNEQDEARFVIGKIQQWVEQGNNRSETAILYRSNAQSRVFEEVLIQVGMPYKVYGGLRFFERAEIKDALAYLRLCVHDSDDPAFERIVNVPTRGIGNKTVEQIRAKARYDSCSLSNAALSLINENQLSSRAHSALAGFVELMQTMRQQLAGESLPQQIEQMLDISQLLTHYQKEKGEKGQARIENLQELINAARGFDFSETDSEQSPLESFLIHAALEAGEGQAQEWEDCVQLMSLHTAKGLEFPMVFLCGLEEGLFPHQRSIDEGEARLEEERRLCYVGMTRAMQQLYLCHAQVRRLYGREEYAMASRFIDEIPLELVENIRAAALPQRQAVKPSGALFTDAPHESGLAVGINVAHAKFGEGVVMHLEGKGEYARVQVHFVDHGSKWLIASYAKLTLI